MRDNAAERGLRSIALGRKAWLLCGSDRGGHRAAAMYSLVVTAKMNGVDPQAWLTDVLSVSQLILPIDWMNCCRGMDAASVSYFSPGRLIMHVNNVRHVTTINRVAKDLGEDEDWISDVANEMEPLKSSSGD